jgi:pyruvate dehydrogenase E1 component alpha subunit
MEGDTYLSLYQTMYRIRAFEKTTRDLASKGMTPARTGRSMGQEAVAAGVCTHLRITDQVGSTHRPLGHLIAKGCDLRLLMAEICGRSTGFNKGKSGPYHVFDPSVGALGANGIVGASVPMVAGYALAHQLKGDGGVAVAFFGEGASNQGGVQEALNLAAVWKLPMVFVCENSSPDAVEMLGHMINYPQLSVERVSARAVAYNIPGSTHDGWDVEAVYEAAGTAVERARDGGGPSLIEFKVYHLEGELDECLELSTSEHDPLRRLRERLEAIDAVGLDDIRRVRKEIETKVKEAVEFASESPEPDFSEALTDVFSGGD